MHFLYKKEAAENIVVLLHLQQYQYIYVYSL